VESSLVSVAQLSSSTPKTVPSLHGRPATCPSPPPRCELPRLPVPYIKGLATGTNGSNSLLHATNFGLGRVDVFDSSFHPTTVSGGFTDPNLPAGYAPFGIRNIDGNLYVSYALQDAEHHDNVSGAGHGFIDVFNTNGVLLERLVTQGALNSPWGLSLAPSNFGPFSGDLLVGNFGDGEIHAYNPNNGTFLGTLDDESGNPIVIQGLWGLDFGNGAASGSLDSLYFTAGIPGPDMVEDHGLFRRPHSGARTGAGRLTRRRAPVLGAHVACKAAIPHPCQALRLKHAASLRPKCAVPPLPIPVKES
jgi:hypothetical protein